MRCAVVIEKVEASYEAYVPDLPGCIAVAEILSEVRALIQKAIAFHLQGLRSNGGDIPAPISLCEYIEAS